ncbi:MAG: tRNA pseudouridine(13) synthase TruD [Planctomycetota bacterium]
MIKRNPSDFFVEEILHPKFPVPLATPDSSQDETDAPAAPKSPSAPAARYALCRLSKEGLSTPEAAAFAARELKVKPGAIAYAGLKDKHASTIQYVTVKLDDGLVVPPVLSGPGWKLENLKKELSRSIQSSDIERNTFKIVARNLTEQDAFDMDEAADLLSVSNKTGGRSLKIVNYFGDQRFGSARHGQGFLAKFLIKGDFETALKLAIATEARKDRMQDKLFKRTLMENWGRFAKVLPKLRPCPERRAVERLANSSGDFRAAFCALPYLFQQLSVYAYQSYLWNGIARGTIEKLCAERGKIIAADDPFGEMLFPEASAITKELDGIDIPLLARKTELVAPWKEAAEALLKEEGIDVSELQIPGVRRPFFGEEPRALIFTAENFTLGNAERDDSADDKKRKKRTLSFKLPRGCYATVLLRALGQ